MSGPLAGKKLPLQKMQKSPGEFGLSKLSEVNASVEDEASHSAIPADI